MSKQNRLVRDSDNVYLFGVCSGIANYFNQDPLLIRALAVLIAIFSGIIPALLAYVILAILMPKENKEKTDGKED